MSVLFGPKPPKITSTIFTCFAFLSILVWIFISVHACHCLKSTPAVPYHTSIHRPRKYVLNRIIKFRSGEPEREKEKMSHENFSRDIPEQCFEPRNSSSFLEKENFRDYRPTDPLRAHSSMNAICGGFRCEF